MIQKWHSSLPLLAFQIQFRLEPENHFQNVLGSRVEAVLLFTDLRNSSRIILGSTRQYLKRAGEIWALFSGSTENDRCGQSTTATTEQPLLMCTE